MLEAERQAVSHSKMMLRGSYRRSSLTGQELEEQREKVLELRTR